MSHFMLHEFACPCCGEARADPQLLQLLEKIRRLVDSPITVTSGYRCPKHNAEVPRAASGSKHTLGLAADIRQSKYSNGFFHTMIRRAWANGELPELGGLGLYETFVHVDVFHASDGHLREWRG